MNVVVLFLYELKSDLLGDIFDLFFKKSVPSLYCCFANCTAFSLFRFMYPYQDMNLPLH